MILVVLLALAGLGWIVFLRQAGAPMHAGHGSMGPALAMGGSWPLFAGMWVAMMTAMMFPAAAPMVVMYGRMRRSDAVSVALFTGAYITLWFLFGGLGFGLAVGAEAVAGRSEWLAMNWGRAGGALIVIAGAYQLTPLKDVCLRHCRTPMAFVMRHWQDGRGGAMRMGVVHGVYCMGCCWLLFLILVPIGLMNVAAMVVVAAIVFVEKVMPWGRGLGRVAAAGLLLYGGAVVLRPELLPTVM